MCLNIHYIVPPKIWTHKYVSQKKSILASNNPIIPLLLSVYTITIRLCWDF